jgi:hypothetical protein
MAYPRKFSISNFLKRLENDGMGLPYFDNIISKATVRLATKAQQNRINFATKSGTKRRF